jgi:DNA modification methylase
MKKIIHGKCLDLLRGLPDNSVDSVVTDPPYGLRFMGKKWDYDVPEVAVWEECLRVLKPGGYLLAFAGTRTQHRMAVRIEDAGFEIRDMIAWVYGSGFPKSLNVGKEVDKLLGNEREVVGYRVEPESGRVMASEPSAHKIKDESNEKYGKDLRTRKESKTLTKGTSEWEGYGTALKPAWESITVAQKSFQDSSDVWILFVSLLNKIKRELCQYPLFAKTAEQSLKYSLKESKEGLSIAQWIAEKNTNIQEDLSVLTVMLQLVLKEDMNWNTVLLWLNTLKDLYSLMSMSTTETKTSLIIDLKTLNSLEWESIFQSITQAKNNPINGQNVNVWNAESLFNGLRLRLETIQELFAQEIAMLKEREKDFAPNLSPLIMSRKPIEKGLTVAENCLKWGVGGINIDGCRVGNEGYSTGGKNKSVAFGMNGLTEKQPRCDGSLGRFPANLIHDGSEEVLAAFPNSKGQQGDLKNHSKDTVSPNGIYSKLPPRHDAIARKETDKSAARFFYCAKASKSERGEGNNHPTVKPVALMAYLVKLVTPANGITLDPYGGSGTTACGAIEGGFGYIVMEREEEYVEIIKNRVAKYHKVQSIPKQISLF